MSHRSASIFDAAAFADGPGGGNICPVVWHADHLSDDDMRRLASERGLECAFVVAPRHRNNALRLRFFQPTREVDMCVHGTAAAVVVAQRLGHVDGLPVSVETTLGAIEVTMDSRGLLFVELRSDGIRWIAHAETPLTDALGIINVGSEQLPVASTGREKLLVPLGDRGLLQTLRPSSEGIRLVCKAAGVTGVYVFVEESSTPNRGIAVARHFPDDAGYLEDAATGLAAGALGAYLSTLVDHGGQRVTERLEVIQGLQLGRPCRMLVVTEIYRGDITRVRVGGRVEVVATGFNR